ncbi:uncharacterized protein LOC111129569 isoform X3 [Crassostrea virginica]
MKVLLATDESKIAKETLKWYMQNLHKDDNQLNLVHVIDNCYQFENKDALIPGDQHLFVLAHDEKKDNAKKLMVEMEDFLKSNKQQNILSW